MKKKINTDWLVASGIRAVKTMAQTALGMFTVGTAVSEVPWSYIISVSFVAGVYSVLTSLTTGIPEINSAGVINVKKDKK